MGNFWSYLSVTVLMVTGVLMIFIILLQRGRGGGLAGAFGGAGGQSALGTKAGDVFTRITVGLAVIWVLVACLSIYALRAESDGRLSLPSAAGQSLEPGTADPENAGDAARATNGTEPKGDAGGGGAAASAEDKAGEEDGPALTPPAAESGDASGAAAPPAGGANP